MLRLIIAPPAPGAWQMALDEALLEACAAGPADFAPVLRLYQFAPTCLSIGYFQPLADVAREACARDGIEVVRRPTGGRAVLHDRDVTYALIAPADGPVFTGGVRLSAQRIGTALLAAVRRLGGRADLTPRPPSRAAVIQGRGDGSQVGGQRSQVTGTRRRRPAGRSAGVQGSPRVGPQEAGGHGLQRLPLTHADCFAAAGTYELAADGRKLAGSAQVRRGGAALQHGTVRLRPDAGIAAPYLVATRVRKQGAGGAGGVPADPAKGRPASLAEILARPLRFDEAAAALTAGFAETFAVPVRAGRLTPDEATRAGQLERDRYRDPGWTARR